MLTTRVLALGLTCTVRPGKISVLTFHSGGFPSTPQGKAIGPNSFAGIVFRRFDGLIGVNQEIMGFFERLRVPQKRTRLIAPHSFLPEEQLEGAMPAALEAFFSAHHPLLISVGLLEPEYDLRLQIDVLRSVRQKFPGTGLLLIGSGSLEPELRRKIGECSYAEDILLCGDVPHATTVQAIARADLMLRTTLYDGDSVSVREALHVGTPVIASDNGMRPAGVHLVPKENPKALLEAINAELALPVRIKRTYAVDDSNMRSVFDFYQELLGDKG
ncbi:MAG TPA: glycosyltransferase [Verrucomicrobiae bacterium]|nr:glycosyltransferase [Verrucomicrobiae bacterium]